jgi:hypothetical protein
MRKATRVFVAVLVCQNIILVFIKEIFPNEKKLVSHST